MKSLTQHIVEKLVINRNSEVKKYKYKYHPKTKDELKKLIKQLIEERGNEADLNDIDVSEITDMSWVFKDSAFNGDISRWDVSKVTNMNNMFFYAFDFNGDISDWDVSSVEYMNDMFYNAKRFNQDISMWDVNKVRYFKDTFVNCTIKEEYKPKFK